MRFEIELTPENENLLRVLLQSKYAPFETLQDVVKHLVYSTVDGIRRPGSWERQWLYPAFGNDFETFLERDPSCPGVYERPVHSEKSHP